MTQRISHYEEKILELQKMKKDLKIQNQELGVRVNIHQVQVKQNSIPQKKKRKKKKKSISNKHDSKTELQSNSSYDKEKRRNSWNDGLSDQISEDINQQEEEDIQLDRISRKNSLDDIIEVSESQNSSLNMRTLSGLAVANRENLSPHRTFQEQENFGQGQKRVEKTAMLPKIQQQIYKPPKPLKQIQVRRLPKIQHKSVERQFDKTYSNPNDILNAIEKAEFLEQTNLNTLPLEEEQLQTLDIEPFRLRDSSVSGCQVEKVMDSNNKASRKIGLEGFEVLVRFNKYHSSTIFLEFNFSQNQTQMNSKIIYSNDLESNDLYQIENQKLKVFKEKFDIIQVTNLQKKHKGVLYMFQFDIQNLQNLNLKNILLLNLLQEQCKQRNEKTCVPTIRRHILFETNAKNNFFFMCEFDNFFSFDQIIDEKSCQQKFYSENELLLIYQSVLKNYEKLEILGITHNNINISNIVYSDQEYKLWNLHYSSTNEQNKISQLNLNSEILQDYYKPPEFFVDHLIDRRALDLYCLGCCFLIIKFLLTDLQLFRDTILTKKEQLDKDKETSSKIISALMNDNVQDRLQVKIKDMISEIKQTVGNLRVSENNLKPVNFTSNIDKSIFLDKVCHFHASIFQWKSIIEIQTNLYELKKNLFGSQSNEYIQSVNYLKKAHMSIKNFKQSNKYNSEYLSIIKNISEPNNFTLAQDLYVSGCIKQQLRVFQESLDDFKQCLDIRKEIFLEENYEIVQTYFKIGTVYQELGQDKLAETHIMKSISVLKSLEKDEYLIEQSLMLDHISDFFIDKSITNNEVKRYLEESYAIKLICLDKNDIKLASVCHKLAIIYHKNNQLDESLSLLKQSISIYEIQQSDPAQIVKLRILYANILIKQSKFQEAKDVLIHSVEEIQIYNNSNSFKQTLQNLAQYATLLELACDPSRALTFYQEAYKLSCRRLGTQNVFSKEMLLRINDNQAMGQQKNVGYQRKKI